jgi:hypothetical protein
VLFVNGFHRSGTTLLTAAVTEATGATTLTAGHLARHLPNLDRFLRSARQRAEPPDRGVDRLPVDESTPEEYCWLLHARTGDYAFGTEAARSGILHTLVDELATDRDEVVVLKNPWDTGRERLLLRHFPDSRVLLLRRGLGAIEESNERAYSRLAESPGYPRALMNDRRHAAEFVATMANPKAREELVRRTKRRIRLGAVRLARDAASLPLDRVAFLSYDELRDDPRAGAAWAAHVLDPEALARAVAGLTFPEYNRARSSGPVIRALDGYWARAWRRARTRQLRAGILPRT